MANEIAVLRGQTYSREYTLTKSDGTPYNLTGVTVWARLFKDFADAPLWSYSSVSHPTKVVVVGSPTAGKVRLDLTPADTDYDERIYAYLLYATDGSGNVVPLVDSTNFYIREAGLP